MASIHPIYVRVGDGELVHLPVQPVDVELRRAVQPLYMVVYV